MVAAAFEEVEGPLELGPDVELSVAAAFAVDGLPRYLDKHTVDLWPAFPQWWHTVADDFGYECLDKGKWS